MREWIDNKHVDVVAEDYNCVALAIMKCYGRAQQAVSDFRRRLLRHHRQELYTNQHSMDLRHLRLLERHRQGDRQTWRKVLVLSHGGLRVRPALERDASKMVIAAGGKVLGSVRHPFGTADMSSFLLQAQAAKPDIIGLANAGADFRNAVAQADEFGVRSGGAQIVALQVTLTNVPALGLEHAHDLLFTDSFYWMPPETRAFAKAFFKRHNAMPTSYQAGVNSALRHYFKAVAATNSTDTATVIKWMRETSNQRFLAQGGKVREDGRMVHDMYLMRIKKPEESGASGTCTNISIQSRGEQAFRPCPKAAALTSNNKTPP